MKYKTALFWLGLAAVAGGVLFETSYDVQELEEQLASLNHKIVQEQEAIQVLRAEWSFLNEPSRLETLARAHLNLGSTDARQFVASVDTLAIRPLPAAPESVAGLSSIAGVTVMPANYVPPGYRATVQAATSAAMPMPASVVPAALAAATTPRAEPVAKAQIVKAPIVKAAAVKPEVAKPAARPVAAARPAPVARPAAPVTNDSIGVMIARLGGAQ